jgi:hypothetical protein
MKKLRPLAAARVWALRVRLLLPGPVLVQGLVRVLMLARELARPPVLGLVWRWGSAC